MNSPIMPEADAPSRLPVIDARQRAADRDLPLLRADEIAGQAERDRKHAAGADAGEDAASRTEPRTRSRPRQECWQTPSSARQTIISRALPNRSAAAPITGWMIAKVKAKTGGKAGGGRDADAKILGDMRQHRIERARGQAAAKRRERDDVERGRQAAGRCGRGRGCVHQRAGLGAFFGSASNAISASDQRLRTRAAAPCWARPTAR